jgi:hypothetical protein
MVETDLIQSHNPLDVTKESIKLSRNSKGFTWEIKILPLKDFLDDDDFKRLQGLNNKMQEEYGRTE